MESHIINLRNSMFCTHLWQGGSGPPLLYLHGASGLQKGEYLNQLCQDFRVYAPWHPGFGPSKGEEYIEDIIDLALYYHDLMDELEIESAHVIGHSLGGMLAAEMAALCPHRIRKLVLVSPLGFWRDDAPVLDFFTFSPQDLLPYLWHDPKAEAIQAEPTPESVEAFVELKCQKTQSLATATKFLWPIPDRGLKRRIHRVHSPTLIVWGESDRLVSPIYAEEFRSRLKDAHVALLPECGHLPMLEKREEFVTLVKDFLKLS